MVENGGTDGPEIIDVAEAIAVTGLSVFKIYYYLSMSRVPGAREVDGEWKIDKAKLLDAHRRGLLR